jgi:hypothetical protein
MDDLRSEVLDFGKRPAAAHSLARMSTERKNTALLAMADQLCVSAGAILRANGKDVEKATADQLSLPMIDRLRLTKSAFRGMADGIREVAALEDPAGKVIAEWTRPNGLHISKVRVPIGVIGIIYESRPNVTSDAAGALHKDGKRSHLAWRLGIDSLELRHCRRASCRRSQRGSCPKTVSCSFQRLIAMPCVTWPRWTNISISSFRAAAGFDRNSG